MPGKPKPWSQLTDEEKQRRMFYTRRWAEQNPERRKEIKDRSQRKHQASRNERRKQMRAEARLKKQAATRAWEAANPELVAMQRVRKRLREREATHNRDLRFHYGITLDDFRAVLEAQGGCCAICGSEKSNNRSHRLFVDHCHDSGMLRGLLCNRCNSALGYFYDNPTFMARAAAYVVLFRAEAEVGDEHWTSRVRSVLGRLPEARSEEGSAKGVAAVKAKRLANRDDPGGPGVAEETTSVA